MSARTIGWIAAAAIGAVAASARPHPLIVYNESASAPVGFYRVGAPASVERGDLVLVPTPPAFRAMAAERGYVPRAVPLVKRVAAVPGQRVCAIAGSVSIDGRDVAGQLAADTAGRALPHWSGCRTLAEDELFLLMPDVRDSFDSRYFGPVSKSSVIGRLTPLWLR